MASIEIRGVDELIRKLGSVEGVKVLEAPMRRSMLRLQRDIANADAVPKMRPGEWAAKTSLKQKRAYWFKVKKLGKHPGRTGTTARGWNAPNSVRISRSGVGLTGRLGTGVKYAPWVQSEKWQARMHRKRWKTDQEVTYNNRNAIVADFEREIRKALRR